MGIGLVSRGGIALHGPGQLVHRQGGFLQTERLPLCALRQLAVAQRDLLGRSGNAFSACPHFANDALQAGIHGRHGMHQGRELIRPGHLHCGRQISLGHALGRMHRRAQRTLDVPHDAPSQHGTQQRHEQGGTGSKQRLAPTRLLHSSQSLFQSLAL